MTLFYEQNSTKYETFKKHKIRENAVKKVYLKNKNQDNYRNKK